MIFKRKTYKYNETYDIYVDNTDGTFKRSSVTDLLACWYVQNFITPLHKEEEKVFDPLDPSQVDLSGIVNTNEPNA